MFFVYITQNRIFLATESALAQLLLASEIPGPPAGAARSTRGIRGGFDTGVGIRGGLITVGADIRGGFNTGSRIRGGFNTGAGIRGGFNTSTNIRGGADAITDISSLLRYDFDASASIWGGFTITSQCSFDSCIRNITSTGIRNITSTGVRNIISTSVRNITCTGVSITSSTGVGTSPAGVTRITSSTGAQHPPPAPALGSSPAPASEHHQHRR
ncbi:hypothetical protein CYMTET_32313 [Cymbomonas tetramitiformis]|uniref:Uncharacterized protein n=1 Tax=Cymbomonas tetramitiformis TaxID=36881 RepID=A0AAE0KSC4_9CHLO|nr:hypothetical protein CYMTET_32313 [Cymbomonas tetramitiformis]